MRLIHRVKTGLWDGVAMMRRSYHILPFLFCLSSIMASESKDWPHDTTDSRGNNPVVYARMFGYDTSGSIGIGRILNGAGGEGCYELINHDVTQCFNGIGLASSISSVYANEPFTFTYKIPYYGNVWGKGVITYGEVVHYVIPVDKDVAQISEMETESYSFGSIVVVTPYILDAIDRPSIGYPTGNIIGDLPTPLKNRGANLILEYLDENGLEVNSKVEHRFDTGELSRSTPSIRWGEPVDTSLHGPNLITIGYTDLLILFESPLPSMAILPIL